MANTLRFKRGLVAGIPTAALGEPLFTTDTFDLYIGNGTGNTRFQKYIASGTTSQLLRGDGSLLTMPIVLTSPANGQVLKYNGTSWVNDSDAGITGSGAAGQVAYFTGATTQSGSNNLFWDATNGRLGVGTNTPATNLHIAGTFRAVTSSIILDYASGILYHYGGSGDYYQFISGANYLLYNRTATGSLIFGTNAVERARIFATGNFGIGTGATDSGQRLQVIGTGYFSDSVGIGSTGLTGYTIRIGRTMTGSTSVIGIGNYGVIQSGVTTLATYYDSYASTQSANFGLTEIRHYNVSSSGTFANVTAGGSVSSQFGFYVDSSITGATNNYGFFGNIASGTGRWNLYMNGTAANYLNGNTGIGRSPGVPLDVAGTIRSVGSTGASSPRINLLSSGFWTWGIYGDGNNLKFQNDATDRLTLNSDGNLGLGVTPSAWQSVYRAIELGYTSLVVAPSNSEYFGLGSNWFYNSAGNLVYKNSVGTANIFETPIGGGFRWRIAPAGTAGNTIAFTQAMTLDASGNLGLGTTAPKVRVHALLNGNASNGFTGSTIIGQNSSSGNSSYLTLVGAFDADAGIVFTDESVGYRGRIVYSNNNEFMSFWTDLSERMRIHATGNLSLNSTTDAGFKLDVNGTMRVSGASTLSGGVTLGHTGGVAVTFPGGQAFRSNGGIFIDYGNGGTGDLVFRRGTGVTNTLTLAVADGAATFSSSVSAATEFRLNNNTFSRAAIIDTNGAIAGGYNFKLTSNVPQHDSTGAISGYYYHNNGYIGWYTGTSQAANTNATERMRLDASGNLGLGVTPSAWSSQFRAMHFLGNGASISGRTDVAAINVNSNWYWDGSNSRYIVNGFASTYRQYLGAHEWSTAPSGTAGNAITFTQAMTLDASGNLLLGSTSSSGERLQVTGTAKISGEFRVAAAINSTQATFANTTGRGLAISTAVVGGTNEAAVVLNARSSVTSGTFIFQTDGTQRVQIDSTGLIINGGNALEFINSAANAVSAIRPTSGGTSVMSTNSNGLHIAVGTEAAGDLILASNNTERVRLSSNGWFSHTSATNPSSSVTDSYVQYSADVTAGNAAPHFRTENGAVIKIYQETTSVGNSIFSQGGGNSVLDDSTFDGYTLRQIVKALRNQGILQ